MCSKLHLESWWLSLISSTHTQKKSNNSSNTVVLFIVVINKSFHLILSSDWVVVLLGNLHYSFSSLLSPLCIATCVLLVCLFLTPTLMRWVMRLVYRLKSVWRVMKQFDIRSNRYLGPLAERNSQRSDSTDLLTYFAVTAYCAGRGENVSHSTHSPTHQAAAVALVLRLLSLQLVN